MQKTKEKNMHIRQKIQNILETNEEKEYLLLNSIQKHCKNSFFDSFFSFISLLTAAGFIWFVLVIFLLISGSMYEITLALALLTALTLHIVFSHYLIKNFIARQRPAKERSKNSSQLEERLSKENMQVESNFSKVKKQDMHKKEKISYSFPSGHACSSFASTTLLYIYHSDFFYCALTFVFLVAFSRIYLYKHFPSDVIAGMLLGVFFAFLAYFITENITISLIQMLA